MTDTLTAHYNIVKIEVGTSSGTWGTKTNTNFDIIDTALYGLEANKQPLHAWLTQFSACDPAATGSDFVISTGNSWHTATAADTRAALGLGDMAIASSANYRNNAANDARYLQNDPGFGAIGSLAIVAFASPGTTTLLPGDLVAGWAIVALGLYFRSGPSPITLGYTPVPLAGTWRLMGYLFPINVGDTTGFGFTLAQRVA